MNNKRRRSFRPGGTIPGPEALEVRTLLSTSPIVVDFNNDGRPDVASGNQARLGNGDGTFRPPSTIAPSPFLVAGSGRFRGAGAPIDLLLIDPGDFATSLGSVAIALGNGDGTFSAPVTLGSTIPGDPVAGQFTADGNLDVMVVLTTPTGQAQLALIQGNGDGTFRPPVRTPLVRNANILGSDDLNGDGHPDLVLNVLNSDDLEVLLGNGDGTFRAPITINSGSNNSRVGDVAIGRLRGPGAPLDLVTANNDFPGTVSVLLGKGDGTFQPAVRTTISDGASPTSVALADLNGDGRLDIVTTNQFDRMQHLPGIDVLLGNGDGTFGGPRFIATDGIVSTLAAVDLNGDGALDVVTTGQDFGVLLNRGDGILLRPGTSAVPTATALTSSLNPAEVGQSVTLTSTVTAQAGTPTGTVTFLDGADVLGTATIAADGRAILTVSLGAGSRTLTASYNGNQAFASSTSGAFFETVFNHGATTTTLTATPTTALVGQAVTFTAKVASDAPGSGTPQGSVRFDVGGVTIGTAVLNASGVATFKARFSTSGDRLITATYSGDTRFATSMQSLTEHVLTGPTRGLEPLVQAGPMAPADGRVVAVANGDPTSIDLRGRGRRGRSDRS
jgi:hypothetical protein